MTRNDRSNDSDSRPDGRRRALTLAAVAVVAGAGFGRLAAAVAHRGTREADEALHDATAVPEEHPVRQAAAAIAPAGKKKMYMPAALVASACILAAPGAREPGALRSRAAGAVAMLLAAAAARGLNPAFDRWLPQPPPPPGHPPDRPVFPSGHAFGPGAVSLATAYVLAREGLAHPAITFPVALTVPLVMSGARVLEEKHWASDVLGGYLGGIALSAGCLATYEVARNA
jgi:membrane-associated phospholipid phosphatase